MSSAPVPNRIAVLLGAGASFDAGIPLTAALADQVLASVNEVTDPQQTWVSALNFAYASMFSYAARDGSNPGGSVNIERLISAIRLLADREKHEAAPFVSAWREPVLPEGRVHADRWNSERFVENLSQALGLGGRGAANQRSAITNIGYFIAEFADAAKRPVSRSDYREADRQLARRLGRLLQPQSPVSYLHPLVDLARRQAGGLDVVTLNYDLTVEKAAGECGIEADRGIADWPRNRVHFDLDDSPLRLYKVHGSLDWSLQTPGRSATQMTVSDGVVDDPWIVVGDREKLATDGPTLELLHAAEEAVERADHLVIVGYGFADTHINHVIRNWMLRDEQRTIGLVEPIWAYPGSDSFRSQLVSKYGGSRRRENADNTQRVFGYQGGAAAELPAALSARLEPDSIDIVHLEAKHTIEGGPLVSMEYRGPVLSHVRFGCSSGRIEPAFASENQSRLTRYDGVPGAILKEWRPGERLQLRTWPTYRNPDRLSIQIDAFTLAAELHAELNVNDIAPADS